ncbi:magnesium and cobalt transport protein CorA, partial [bacterium]|nr:magnesium and cobalt transport protein CorA [bacterium]
MKLPSTLRQALKRRSRQAGRAPGERLEPEFPDLKTTRINAIAYDVEQVEEIEIHEATRISALLSKPGIKWIDVDALRDVKPLQDACEALGLHTLVIEDIINTDQRTKIEDYGEVLFVVLKRFTIGEDGQLSDEQISIVLGKDFVLSVGERETDQFGVVRDYIRSGKPRVRLLHHDYLAYRLMDSIVDSYYGVLDHISNRMDRLEAELVNSPNNSTLPVIFEIK